MKIIAGGREITVGSIFGEKVYLDGMAKPIMRLELVQPMTAEDLEAMLQNDWHIFEDSGTEELSVQQGFSRVYQHQITFLQVTDADKQFAYLQAQLAEERSKRAEAEAKLSDVASRAGTLEAEKQEAMAALETVTQELTAAKAVLPIDESDSNTDIK